MYLFNSRPKPRAMNYLAHLYLADTSCTSLAGSVLGDSVKGRLSGEYPPAIEQGIRLHRRIDTFTDSHPRVLAACAGFAPPYRRYAGILLDIYFDYLLAHEWNQHHNLPLHEFARYASKNIWLEWPRSPMTKQRMAGFADVLLSYGAPHGVETALQRVAGRAKRTNPMAQALPLLQTKHDELATEFRAFFPDLKAFVRREIGST